MIRQVFHRGSMQYLAKKGVQKRHTLKHYNALLPTRVAPNCTQIREFEIIFKKVKSRKTSNLQRVAIKWSPVKIM